MPAPKAGETQKEFVSRCIPIVIREGKDRDQAVAICHSMWKNKKSKSDSYKSAKGA